MSKLDVNRKDEMFRIIEAYQKSGLSQPAFCRQEGLNKSTFLYWLKKYRKEQQKDFLPLQVGPAKTTFNLELDLPNGIKIRIEG